jgi:hypothetical protein
VFDEFGIPIDPDSSQLYIHIEDINNSEILPNTLCTREQAGVYLYRYTVHYNDIERPLWVEFLFDRLGQQFLVGQVTETIKTDAHTQSLDLIKLTTARANNLDNLDAAITTRQSSVTALSQYNQIRLDIAGVQSHLSSQDSYLSNIQFDTSKIGVPVHGTLAADNTALASSISNIQTTLTKLGIPLTGTISGDIAALEAHLDAQDIAVAAVKADTNLIGHPAFGTLAADDQEILDAIHDSDALELVTQAQITSLSSKVGTPAHGTVSADIAAIQSDTSTLTTRLTAQRALNLDYLDVSVASREAETDASWRYNSLFNGLQAILASIGAIPNNTTFVGIVPPIIVLPPQPVSKTYKFFVNLFDAQGMPEDPDVGVTYRIEDVTGAVIVANTSMIRTDVGAFYCQYPVAWNDPERTIFVVFMYHKGGIPLQQTRIAEVQEYESKLDILLQRLSDVRAHNLDRLDASISSRASAVDLTAYYSDLAARCQAIMDEATIIETILGSPVISIAADIASVQGWVTKIGNPTSGTLAGDLSQIKLDTARIGMPVSGTLVGDLLAIMARIMDVKYDVSLVKVDTSRIGIPSGGTVAVALTEIMAKLGASSTSLEDLINNINFSQVLAILGIPAHGTVSNDIAGVSSQVTATQVTLGLMQTQVGLLPGIATTVSTIAGETSTVNPKLDTLQTDVDALAGIEPKVDEVLEKLNTLESCCEDVQNSIAAIPLNPLREDDPRLVYLDAAISSRATPSDCGGGGNGSGVSMMDIAGIIDSDIDELQGILEEVPEGELQGILDDGEELIGLMEEEDC